MGTTFSLFVYADYAAQAQTEASRCFDVIDQVEALLSNYQPQSELARINRGAYAAPVTTDPETLRFLRESLAWSARSDGAFDITVGALMKGWGFFRSTGRVPSPAALTALRRQTGWLKVKLDETARTVRFTALGLELDPGGIGKGFAVDRAVEILRADGVHAALLSAGSSTIYALGAPAAKPGWRVDVPDPARRGATLSTVLLRDTSLSTASCAEKHFVLDGHFYCHIMDPRLLRPVEGRLQATVITPSATDGDALSNVLFVDDARARAAVMQPLPPADSALVVSGMPAEDTPRNGGRGDNKEDGCDRYRWLASLRQPCAGAARITASQKGKPHEP